MPGLVDLAAVRGFLGSAPDPAVRLQTALEVERLPADHPGVRDLREELYAAPRLQPLLLAQRDDGSWGDHDDPRRRILSTLWPAKVLTEIGVRADHEGLARALDFLEAHALVEGGASIDGGRRGVLPCYTGILADTFLQAGRLDAAKGPLEWLATYQQVRHGGRDLLAGGRPTWDRCLTSRYGGCFAETTCLLGIVKGAQAMVRARDLGVGPVDEALLAAVRDLLAERAVFHRRDGTVIPLGAAKQERGEKAERWLLPAFPLTYQTDLLEVTTLAAGLAVPRERLGAALDRLAALRLPDGTWPMLRRCSAPVWHQPERVSRRTGSRWVTLRVLRLDRLLSAVPG